MLNRNAILTGLSLVLCAALALPAVANNVFKQEFGQVSPRGGATLTNPSDGPLTVSNIGSSGQDGVRIDTGNAGSIGPIRWMAPEALRDRGLFVTVDAEDPLGIPCAFASAFTFNGSGDCDVIFNPLTSPVSSLIVRVYDGQNPLFEAQATEFSNPLYASSMPPIGMGTTGPYLPYPPYEPFQFGWQYPPGTSITLPGMPPVLGDLVVLEFLPSPPQMTLLSCEILGLEPQGAIGELRIVDYPSTLFHHQFGSRGQGEALMVGNIGSSGQDGVRVSNIGSSGLDGVCIELGANDSGLGATLLPMEMPVRSKLFVGGLSWTPQGGNQIPLPLVSCHYVDSFFDIWPVTAENIPVEVELFLGDDLITTIPFPRGPVRLLTQPQPPGSNAQAPFKLALIDSGSGRLSVQIVWTDPLRYSDGTGIDNDCDGIVMHFDPPIGGPWVDWDFLTILAQDLLGGELTVTGTPNTHNGDGLDDLIVIDECTGLGSSDVSSDSQGRLKISNLGSSGCDGVSIAPPGGGTGSGMGISWSRMEHQHPHYHVTVLKAFGSYGGSGGGSGGRIIVRAADTGSKTEEWGISVDFSDLGPDDVTLDVYNEGQLVASVICAGTIEECLQLSAGPISCEVVLDHPDGHPRMRVGLPPQTDFTDPSGPMKMMNKADLIEAVYNGTPVTPFTEITSVDVLMGNLVGDLVIDSAGETSGLSAVDRLPAAARAFELVAPSPNPFNPRTVIAFDLKRGGEYALRIFDLRGQKVRDLFTGYRPVGQYRVIWDGMNDDGREVASGTYLFRLSGNGDSQARKAVLIR